MELLKPVYLKYKEIQCGQNRISDYDLSIAVSNIINDVKCVQKDRDLWRIYVDSTESRSQLLAQGIDLRNTNIRVYDTNPYSAGISSPSENVLKITVKGVPLSVDDNEVIKMLNDFNVSFTSELKYENIRHPITRKMTCILNGNRFIYAKSLAEGTFLPRTATCAGLRCFIYHYGQPSAKRTPRCTNCWEEHHFSKTALTQKDARCANLKVTCLVIRSASSFLKMKLMSLHLLVRTTVCPTFIHATSTSSASAIGLRNTPSNTLRLCAVGISRGQRRYNQLNQPLMPKKLGNLSLLPPALQTIRWP